MQAATHRALATHYSERSMEQCLIADRYADEQAELKDAYIESRAADIINSPDYHDDLIAYVCETPEGLAALWMMRSAKGVDLAQAQAGLNLMIASYARKIARSEAGVRFGQ